MLDPEGDLQEIPSSDDDDTDAAELRGRIQKIRERTGIESPDYTSPIGSPRDDEGPLSAKGRFLEFKRLMQDDKPSRSSQSTRKTKPRSILGSGNDPEEFEEVGDEWTGGGSPQSYHDDVEELLESFRSERAGERGDYSSISQRLENHPKMIEVYQQLRDRDLKILGLESKLMELDRQVIDFQDTLSERDKLLSSKNEAVNCMVNQYQQNLLEKEADLIKTQDTLFELERKFGSAQDQWKSEKDRLNTEIKQQNTRLKDLEDTNKLLESARLDQTSRDLELEEKLNILKEDRNRLTQENAKIQSHLDDITNEKECIAKKLQTKSEEFEAMIGELKASLVKSTEQTTKLKQQFQAKLKALKEQFSSKEIESQTKITTLQNELAELEQQIKTKSTEDQQQPIIASLESQITKLEEQLKDNPVEIELRTKITTLENEVLKLQEQDQLKDDFGVTDVSKLQFQIVTLENRIAELEEEKGSLILVQEELSQIKIEKESAEKESIERLGEFERNFEERVEEYEKKIEEYEKKVEENEKKIEQLNSSLEKSSEQMTKMKRQFQAKLKAVREESKSVNVDSTETTGKITALENRVAELEEEKGNNLWLQEELNQIKLEKEALEKTFEEEIKQYQNRIEELSDSMEKSSDQISRMEQQQKISVSVSHEEPKDVVASTEIQQTRITALEYQVAELEEEKGSGFLVEEELCKMKLEREILETSFQEKTAQFENQIKDLNAALLKSTEQMTKMKRQFQAKLKSLREDKSKEEGSPISSSPSEAELEGKIMLLENRVAELEEEKGNLLLQQIDYDEQQATRQGVGQDNISLQEENIRYQISLAEKEEELRLVQEQLNEMTAALSQKNGEVEQLMKNCSEMQQSLQQKVDELSSSVNAKEEEVRKVILEYEDDNRLANDRITQLENEASLSAQQLIIKETEMQELLEKLTGTESRFEEMSALVSQYQGMLEGVRVQDQGELLSLQNELESIKQKASTAAQSYEAMKAAYTEEMSLRVKTISQLQEELARMTNELSLKTAESSGLADTLSDIQKRFETAEIQYRNSETEYQNQIEQLSTKLAACETEIGQLKILADNYQTVASLEFSLNEKENQFKTLENELRNDISAKVGLIETLNWKLTELENENVQTVTNFNQSKQENDSLNIKIVELSNDLESAQKEIQAVKYHYSNAEASYNQMYNELGLKSVEIQQLLTVENQSKSLIEDLQNQITQQTSIKDGYQKNLSTLENEKSQLTLQLNQVAEESESLRKKLTDLTNEFIQLRESVDSKDIEAQRLRQDANTLQSEYSHTNNELKLKISALMDQLNECENEISVVTNRLKESDDSTVEIKSRLEEAFKTLEEKSRLLEDKSKALEIAEHSLFEKTEEVVRIEEKIREIEEKHRLVIEENFAKYSNDLDTTYDQLAASTNENQTLLEKLKKRDSELNDLTAQLQFVSGQISNYEAYSNDQRERMSYLENQLSLAGRQLEEVKVNENAELQKVAELRRELEQKQILINELNVELQEQKNLKVNLTSATTFQQGAFQDQNQLNQNASELEEKDRKIYELEVQMAELQINVDDLNSQQAEITELKTTLDVYSYRIKELEDENSKLKQEVDKLKRERTQNIQALLDMEAISGQEQQHPQPSPTTKIPTPQVPVDEQVIRAVAYVTTDTSLSVKEEEQQQQQGSSVIKDQYDNALKEIKELKVKNGKMIQRFKQLKDKYETIVKENEQLKTKKAFSLDSAFEDEFLSQVKQKETQLEDKGKLIIELQAENQRLSEKLDLLERGTERLTEMKEEQDRSVQQLLNQRRVLETEVSALKWKVEELENISLTTAGNEAGTDQSTDQNTYFAINAADQAVGENTSLRQQNYSMNQELQALQWEIHSQKKVVDELHERNQQLEEEMEKLQELQIEQHQDVIQKINISSRGASPDLGRPSSTDKVDSVVLMSDIPQTNIPVSTLGPQTLFDSALPMSLTSVDSNSQSLGAINEPKVLDNRIDSLQKSLQSEQQEKAILEKKIELLQSKISEIEVSEIKCFEESLMLKSWTRQLELDNLKVQRELERIYSSIQEGNTGNLKVTVLQDEVLRLVDALQDRDKRCEQLTLEITRLLEERDTLQLKLSNVLRHNVSLHEEVNKGREPPTTGDIPSYDTEALQLKLADLEQITYSMGIDLRREREARRLVQEQLFFSSSSRIYQSGANKQSSQSPPRSIAPSSPTSYPSPIRSSTPQPQQLTPAPIPEQQQFFQPQPVQLPSPSPPHNDVPTLPTEAVSRNESSNASNSVVNI